MEVEDTNDQLVTIYFDDDDVNDQFNKSYLIEHSDYFSIMFNGNFIESQTGYQTYLKVFIDLLITNTSFLLYLYNLTLMK